MTRRVPVTSRLLVATALLVAGAVAGPGLASSPGEPPAPTRCPAGGVTRVGDWEAIAGPSFLVRPGGGGAEVTAFAVHPRRPQVRLATNGTSVERTDDGGCTWREVYALPDVPSEEDTLAVATAEVVEVVVPLDQRLQDQAVLLVRDRNGGPRVLASTDGGAEEPFRDRSEGLPPTGTPTDLLVAATNPDFYFLAASGVAPEVDPGPGGPVGPGLPLPDLPPLPGSQTPLPTSPGALYASVDGGLTWELRLDTADLGASTTGIDVLAGHPTAPNTLWAVSDGVLRSSTDGGRTFAGPGPSAEEQAARGWQVTALVADVLRTAAGTPTGTVVVTAFSATSSQDGPPLVMTSIDGGRTYDDRRAPGVVDAAATFVPGTGDVVASTRAVDGTPAGVHLLDTAAGRPDRVVTVSPAVGGPDLAVTADRSDRPTFHARAGTRLLRYVGPAAALPPPLPPVVGGVVEDGVPPLGRGSITPERDVVRLPVGGRATVDHTLRTPQRLTPLDLFLLVDTSESMRDDLPEVRAQLLELVDLLRSTGLDVSVGLGEFKGGESTVAYRRVVGLGPSVDALRRGLGELVADGFGQEAQLIALEQALDGAGETPADLLLPDDCRLQDPEPDRFVQEQRRTAPPVLRGQAADFRRGSVPVVLTVTDTNFLRPAGTPLKDDCSVDVESVASAYAARGVHAVGLGVDDVDNGPRAADLTLLARATGALQPPDRACAPGIDPTPGAPAVCRAAADLLPTLVRLAAQRREPADLQVAVSPTSGWLRSPVDVVRAVDLRRARVLDLPLDYSCVDLPAGTYAGGVDVLLAGVSVARVSSTLVCEAATVRPVAPVVPRPPGVAVAPQPVPPPPAPPAQAVQPQVNTQPQANPQVQSGTQDEQQEQVDVALALQEAARQEGTTSFALSGRSGPGRAETPGAAYLTAVAMVTAAASVVARRRLRTSHARVVRVSSVTVRRT